MKTTNLEQRAVQLFSFGHDHTLRLTSIVPQQCVNVVVGPVAAYLCTVVNVGNQKFNGVGSSPTREIINALCYERIADQGWG